MSYEDKATAVAKAADTYDLLQHIAWTNIIKPQLDKEVQRCNELLVSEALGIPMPGGFTREQVAGKCYGIMYMSSLFEKILRDGEKALKDLNTLGLHLA